MSPVGQQVQRFAIVDFPHERERKQESRDEEENIHTTGNFANPHMVKHHEKHGEGAQTLNFGAESARFQKRFIRRGVLCNGYTNSPQRVYRHKNILE